MAEVVRTFDEIIGHKNTVAYLKEQVAKDRVANFIIFHGNPGLGKSSLAKILAVEVAMKFESEERREEQRRLVIDENKSTDTIKLFTMTEIQDKEEAIQKVKAELCIGFSSTGRKVVILDEAHGMHPKAQEAILTDLEHLDKNLYVFICTTEVGTLKTALLSRSGATLVLNGLSTREANELTKRIIHKNCLSFNFAEETAVAMICTWADNEPRKICNLLERYEYGSVVTAKDLEVFINVSTAASIIELLKYLYGSITLGMAYIDSLRFDEGFVHMLIEVCKVAMGYTSKSMSNQDIHYIHDFMTDKDPMHIMRFTAEVAGLYDLRKRRVLSAFMKSHVAYKEALRLPERVDPTHVQAEDYKTLQEHAEGAEVLYVPEQGSVKVPSLEELFAGADTVE